MNFETSQKTCQAKSISLPWGFGGTGVCYLSTDKNNAGIFRDTVYGNGNICES